MSAHSQFIHRELTSLLMERIRSNKVLLIYGTRRVGKTELARHLASGQENPLFLNAEDERVQRLKIGDDDFDFSTVICIHCARCI